EFVLVAMLGRRRRGILILEFVPPPQIRMHHVALDRTGPHDCDLDDEIVEGPRFQPWQHVHLRPALDLEYAEGFAAAQHVVDWLLILRVLRDRRQFPTL